MIAPGSVVAGCFALAAFAVAIVAGLAADNPALTILVRAILALAVCYPVGLCIGHLCQRTIESPPPNAEAPLDDEAVAVSTPPEDGTVEAAPAPESIAA